MKKQVVGILGGTFDPIHIGHVQLAQQALKSLPIERLLIIPNGQPDHREEPMASWEHRMEMAKIAVRDLGEDGKGIEVSDLEPPGKPRYTVDTVRLLLDQGMYPVIIAGADSFGSLKSWYKWEELLEKASFAVAQRHPELTLDTALEENSCGDLIKVTKSAASLAKRPCVWGWDFKPARCSSLKTRFLLHERYVYMPCLPKAVASYLFGNYLYWEGVVNDPSHIDEMG